MREIHANSLAEMFGDSIPNEYPLKELPQEQYEKDISDEIKKIGITEFVKKRCDEISELCSEMYTSQWLAVHEQLSEILFGLEAMEK